MSKATITFSDDNGAIRGDVHFEGGFDPKSHAHQHAQILLKMMDQLAPRVDEPEQETETPLLVAPPTALKLVQG